MHPDLTLSLAGHQVELPAIGLLYVLAWVIGLALATLVAWRRGLPWFWALFTYACAIVAGIVGARLLHIADNWGYYVLHPGSMKTLEFQDFALYGGLILAALVGAWTARAFRLRVWRMADSAVPALALGIALMRVGCFFEGCCFGTATSLPWGVTYPEWSRAWFRVLDHQVLAGETGLFDGPKPVHPTQIYEVIAALIVGLVAGWLLLRGRRSKEKPRTTEGVAFLAFAFLFTVFRLFDHYLRAHTGTFKLPDWFYPLLYGFILAVTLALLLWRVRPRKGLRLPGLLARSRSRTQAR
jgi:phosphatidylglycerol:prolipoprotein diacylglycerol transferase